ncbi:MAG: FHA domain-containing protein [Alcanivorax sp.]|nr:FHA domain-containing protein [Alcanivorax sp.]
MLQLRFNDRREDSGIWLSEPRYIIGRDATNTIVIDEPGVSAFHAELIVEADNRVYLTDLGSEKGTFLNGAPVDLPTRVMPADVIRLHDVELELADPSHRLMRMPDDALSVMFPEFRRVTGNASPYDTWTLYATAGPLLGQRFPVPPAGNLVLGRSQHSDVVLAGVHISRRHAQIWSSNGRLFVCDMDSASGTWVNRKKISETELNPGDDMRIDNAVFRIESPRPGAPAHFGAGDDAGGVAEPRTVYAGQRRRTGSTPVLSTGAITRFAGRH